MTINDYIVQILIGYRSDGTMSPAADSDSKLLVMNGLRIARWGIVAVALGLIAVPLPKALVERWYSSRIYPAVQPRVIQVSNAVPVALFDPVVSFLVVVFVALLVRDVTTRGWLRGAGRAVTRLVAWAAVLYLVFLAAWGLNYRRLPLEQRVAFDAGAVTPDAAARLATTAVDRLNALHDTAHARRWATGSAVDPPLAQAFNRAMR